MFATNEIFFCLKPASDTLGRDTASDVEWKIYPGGETNAQIQKYTNTQMLKCTNTNKSILSFSINPPESHALGLVDRNAVLFHPQIILKSLPAEQHNSCKSLLQISNMRRLLLLLFSDGCLFVFLFVCLFACLFSFLSICLFVFQFYLLLIKSSLAASASVSFCSSKMTDWFSADTSSS